ncbi:MAG: hypothetical protein ACHQM6_00525, partial [Candidatus Kapaibacterium sp.]
MGQQVSSSNPGKQVQMMRSYLMIFRRYGVEVIKLSQVIDRVSPLFQMQNAVNFNSPSKPAVPIGQGKNHYFLFIIQTEVSESFTVYFSLKEAVQKESYHPLKRSWWRTSFRVWGYILVEHIGPFLLGFT